MKMYGCAPTVQVCMDWQKMIFNEHILRLTSLSNAEQCC